MTTIGDRIRETRKEKRITQTELARRTGLSGAAISDLESSVSTSPQAVAKIALALEVNPAWLTDGVSDKHSVPDNPLSHGLPRAVVALAEELVKLPDEKLKAIALLANIRWPK